MRAMLGMAIGAVLALTAGVAVADEVTGTMSNIDLTRNDVRTRGQDIHGIAEQHGRRQVEPT